MKRTFSIRLLLLLTLGICMSIAFLEPRLKALSFYYFPPTYTASEIPPDLKVVAFKLTYDDALYGGLTPNDTVTIEQVQSDGSAPKPLATNVKVWDIGSHEHEMMVMLLVDRDGSEALYLLDNFESLELRRE